MNCRLCKTERVAAYEGLGGIRGGDHFCSKRKLVVEAAGGSFALDRAKGNHIYTRIRISGCKWVIWSREGSGVLEIRIRPHILL